MTRYSDELVVSSPAELPGRLDRIVDPGFMPLEALERIRNDFDVGFDGKALERYKREMLNLAGMDGSF